MALRYNNNRRRYADNIIIAIIAGFLLGLAAFFLKIVMSGKIGMAVIYSPFAWITLALAISGFLLMQSALQGHVSRIIPIITGLSILVSVVAAYVFLGEAIADIKWLGIFLVLIGVFGLSINNEKY